MNMYIFHKNLPQFIYILALVFPKKKNNLFPTGVITLGQVLKECILCD